MTEHSIPVRPWRLQTVLGGLLLTGVILFVWTIYLQFLPADQALEIQNEGDRYKGVEVAIQPARGLIYDSSGALIAGNQIVYEVGLELQFKGTPEAIARVINGTIGMDYQDALAIANLEYSEEDAVYAVFKRNVNAEDAHALENILTDWKENYNYGKDEESLSGVVLFPYLGRTYPEDALASSVIGFVNYDGNAYYGLEQRYDNVLAGKSQKVYVPNNPNYASELPDIPAGSTLILTIDREIQRMLEEELDKAMEVYQSKSASAIILNPQTGDILAMGTTPRLNINEFWDFSKVYPGSTPFNRLISQTFEPGSVFKIFTMAAAIDAGTVELDTTFFDSGYFEYGGIVVRNWDRSAWGQQDMVGCMQHSLNVCLAWVGVEMGAEKFYSYMDAFGFGHYTSVDLSGEATGRLKEPGDGDWYPSDLATNTFGQGVSVNALQIVTGATAIANGGQMMLPHVTGAIIDNGVQIDVKPQSIGTPISPETSELMNTALSLSLENEASGALVEGYRIAGKTGTAEIPGGEGYLESTNASFIGWGPIDDPQFMVYVWLEEPTPIWGSLTAANVFHDITQRLVVMMKLPPDDVRQQLGMN